MLWYLVLENVFGDKSIYLSNVTREVALKAIEELFETGYLSGKKYTKRTAYLWQYLEKDKLHLVNEKQLRKVLYGTEGFDESA